MKGPQPFHMKSAAATCANEAPKPAAASGGNRQAKRGKSQGAAESRDYVSFPEGCKPLPISFSGRAHSAQENDVYPLQECVSRLAA